MNPAIVIPTYWSQGDTLGEPGYVVCYDHATPIDSPNPELETCVASLEQVAGLGTVIVLVVAPPAIEEQAVHRVNDILQKHNIANGVIVDSFKALSIANMFQDLLPQGIGEPISLRGYGAIRNIGLVACAALGCDVAVFLDDDEVVLDPDFLTNAVYGLGAQPRQGMPVVAKSGYFLDRRNSALADRRKVKFHDKYWAKRAEFNEWMTQALAGPRISRSNVLCGGCFAVHAEAYTRVAFDPWITRGEDMDYLLNLKLYGMDVWFDNRWRVRHMPPRIADTAKRFLQNVYRWVYERRHLEVCNANIVFNRVTPAQLMPYPGPWISPELPKRVSKTAFLRAILSPEHGAYWKIYRTGLKDAAAYAEENCVNYLHFQAAWNQIATRSWQNESMYHILHGEGLLSQAVAQRMAARNAGFVEPVVNAAPAAAAPAPVPPATPGPDVDDPFAEPSNEPVEY